MTDYIELTSQLFHFDICLFTYGIINQDKNKNYWEHKSKIPLYLYIQYRHTKYIVDMFWCMILLEEINFRPLNSTKDNIHKELLSEEE